jgi:NAD(P)-dependent dehydrogenase (short-subunit alcohol dehydrogenase family)
MLDFYDKTAVVTGAAGNIGQATAQLLASRGANVLAVDINDNALEKTLDLLKSVNPAGNHAVCQADVTHPPSVKAYALQAASLMGEGIDVFFNNAGIEGATAPVTAYPEDSFDKVMEVNVKGVFLGLKYVLYEMNTGGAVVNTASVAGLGGSPNMIAYTASKHAVIGMTKTAALEMVDENIRVNAICPAPVRGRMMKKIEEGLKLSEDKMSKAIPMKRYGTPAEIANFVVMLLSDEAKYLTGGIYTVDGGLRAR